MLTTTVAGRTWNYSHTVGRAAAAGAGFVSPISIVAAPEGVLYVVNRGHAGGDIGVTTQNQRIGKVTIDEEFLGEFGRREFTWPASLALDRAGNVYCSDEYENFIAIYDEDGQKVGKWGEAGAEPGRLNGPSGLAFGTDENLLVVDSLAGRVQRFAKDGSYIGGFGSEGDGPGQFSRPWGITVDADGDVYVADWGNNRVQKFSPDGELLLTFGDSANGAVGLNRPADVAVDSDGDVYVTDWGNKLVRIYAPDGDPITSLKGDAEQFSKWAQEVVDSNPDVIKAYRRVEDLTPLYRFDRPTGIAVDEQDRIIITDSNRARLQVYAKEKEYLDPQFNL